MARGDEGLISSHIRTLFELGAVGSMSDRELLDRFLESSSSSNQTAFRILVERHGPMVLHVCRGVLESSHDVEDAFQATFLVLARNARSIRNRDSIGPWLFGVARKVSRRVRGTLSRRQLLEVGSIDPDQFPGPVDRGEPGEFEDLLREIDRLPKRLRVPLILTYWQGMTYDESAAALGLTEGTVRGRLARARNLLRSRLASRGTISEAIQLGSFPLFALQPVPRHFIWPTVQAAASVAVGQTMAGIVPASIVKLSEEGAWPMFLTLKSKLAVAATLAVLGLLSLGSGVVAWQKPQVTQLKPQQGDRSLIGEDKKPARAELVVDGSLANLVDGKVVRSVEVTKDCMVLAYLPDWGFGNVDNIGFEGHDGGVRTLVNWPDVPATEAASPTLKFYLAFYSRKTVEKPKSGSIVALEISSDWPEATSWKTRPYAEAETVGTYKFVPGEGWKVFEITPYIRATQGKARHGLMFRYINEDRPGGSDWTGYQIVSREGSDRWANKRPRLLVVEQRDLEQ